MGRNEFEASHFCPKVNKEIKFSVLIGSLAICPECQEVIDPPNGEVSDNNQPTQQDSNQKA